MEKVEKEKLIKLCSVLNGFNCLQLIYGKIYKVSELTILLENSNYIILGTGVIESKNLDKLEGQEKLKYIEENIIQIQTEEEFQAFKEKLILEKKEHAQQKEFSEKQWETILKNTIEENTSKNTSSEEKNRIFKIVVNCPVKKEEIKPYYWEVFDIVGTAEKTRNIFNAKDGIKLNKNDFPQKNRENKEEEN
ncbi:MULTISPECIES: hypothetical protein [Fusobacterium]|uniref:hypothetical protein n=1 Tax=Fusobacterium TaxID=848 RepID=UPI0014771F06|nr:MULTISPECIES: hypothetical protein [Fusobacterium]NME35602.1 hypothetical protein [Fusobacterium sp. FSA-380-WT-3A]